MNFINRDIYSGNWVTNLTTAANTVGTTTVNLSDSMRRIIDELRVANISQIDLATSPDVTVQNGEIENGRWLNFNPYITEPVTIDTSWLDGCWIDNDDERGTEPASEESLREFLDCVVKEGVDCT